MASQDEPASKRDRSIVNFALCIKCQTKTAEPVSQSFKYDITKNIKHSTYSQYLSTVHLRASYGNRECVTLKEKLRGITANDLREQQAT